MLTAEDLPVMNINSWAIGSARKIRAKRRAIAELVRVMAERADGGQDYDGKVLHLSSDCLEDARALASLIEGISPT